MLIIIILILCSWLFIFAFMRGVKMNNFKYDTECEDDEMKNYSTKIYKGK